MKVLLINDTTDWYHFGCTGTSLMLKDQIQKLGHTIASMPIYACMSLNNAPQIPSDFFAPELQHRFISSNHEWFEKIQNSDIIVVNGEGTLHGSKKGPLALMLLAYLAKTKFQKNVQIINHSVYPNDDLSIDETDILRIYMSVYQAMDYVAIREPISLHLMRTIGVNATESFDCLPIYIRDFYKTLHTPKQDKLILISGSAAWFQSNVFLPGAKPEFDVLDGLNKLCKVLNEKISQGYEVCFLQSATSNPSQDDIDMIKYLKSIMGDNLKVLLAPTLDVWLQEIERATLLISGRFHHSIAASCLGTNFVILNSNTPKNSGLTAALGLGATLIFGDPNLEIKLHDAIEHPYKTDAKPVIEELCVKADKNFAKLRF